MIPFRVYRHLGFVQRVGDNFFDLIPLVLLAQATDGFLGNVVVVLEESLDRRHRLVLLTLFVQRRRSDRTGGGCFSAATGWREGSGNRCSRMTRMLEQRWNGRTIAAVVVEIVSARRAR